MGDIAVKIKGNRVTCQIGKPKISVYGTPFAAGFALWASNRPLYPNDEAATDPDLENPLSPGDWYRLSADTDIGTAYTLKQVAPL